MACYVACYVYRKKQGPASLQALDLYGAGTRSRTRDLLITSQTPKSVKTLRAENLLYAPCAGLAFILRLSAALMYAEKTVVPSSVLYRLTVDKAVGIFRLNQLLNHRTGSRLAR